MRYGSVCSGIEAATVAWDPLGWEAAWFAEIEAFPSVVLAHHYPEVSNLGDFTAIDRPAGSIDLLVGGTPCQSFSVAGLRGGLDDARGNLALEFLRLAGRLRPEWLVWENVPGVLSSSGGRDFGAFLGGMVELGYGFSYRVLDAQHFGVPQRRRRVFVVGHLGDWRCAVAVLFERHSLSGNPPPGREAGTRTASSLTGSLGRRNGAPGKWGEVSHNLIAHTLRADGFDASEDGTGRGTPLVPVAFNWQASGKQTDLGCDSDGTGALSTSTVPAVGYIVNAAESCAVQSHARQSEVARCLDSCGGFAPSQGGTVVSQATAVRRLTPMECERLQGFPDSYTLVPYRGKPAADGPRYKALGNSFAVPVVRWIGQRIQMVDDMDRKGDGLDS